ncbi:hypothetical protein D3C80_1316450 [compost metagenome]
MVERPGRQVGHLLARRIDAHLPVAVGEAHHGIGVGDVQPVADQRHAERRVEPGKEFHAPLGHTIAVAVSQQGDAIGAWHRGASPRHDFLGDPALDPAIVLGLGRRIGFGHQYVTVGEGVQPAGMVEVLGEALHRQARRRAGRRIRWPADGGGDVHGR